MTCTPVCTATLAHLLQSIWNTAPERVVAQGSDRGRAEESGSIEVPLRDRISCIADSFSLRRLEPFLDPEDYQLANLYTCRPLGCKGTPLSCEHMAVNPGMVSYGPTGVLADDFDACLCESSPSKAAKVLPSLFRQDMPGRGLVAVCLKLVL